MTNKLTCFKAYDIRGELETELNVEIAYRIGRAFGIYISPEADLSKTVAVGGDIRLTSDELKLSVANGLLDSGVNVIDIGMTGTEEIYFATQHLELDGGVEITASHNPINYNGMKLVREGSKPISGDSGLKDIQHLAEKNQFPVVSMRGKFNSRSNLVDYVDHLINYIKPESYRPMKVVVNSGNGAAGHVVDEIERRFQDLSVPIEFIKINHLPDGNFPNGIPNPLLPECRSDTSSAVIKHKADVGIAWDGDFDRCFFFDENGEFIEGYYIVGLLAEAFLNKNPGEKIIHDPRLSYNTVEIVKAAGGTPVLSKTGHAFIKERMRQEDAVYGGEMSAHHYFRDFAYCDSGMIPWLLVTELLSKKRIKLSQAVKQCIDNYPSSGEINRRVADADKIMDKIHRAYKESAVAVDYIDGISLDMGLWRFNIRQSNTEALLRLNVESKGDVDLMKYKTKELLRLIELD